MSSGAPGMTLFHDGVCQLWLSAFCTDQFWPLPGIASDSSSRLVYPAQRSGGVRKRVALRLAAGPVHEAVWPAGIASIVGRDASLAGAGARLRRQ
jgi:hypothetical protein